MIMEAWKPFYAGGQVHTFELCKRLVQNHNCNVDVYSRKLIKDGKKYSTNEIYEGGKLKFIRTGFGSDYFSYIGRFFWIFSTISKCFFKKYDIIHGQANLGGLPAKILGWIKKVPVVYTVHGSGLDVWDEMGKGFSAKVNYNIEKFLQTGIKYDKEISVDKTFLKYKNKNQPIVIANGVDIKKYDLVNCKKDKNFKIIFVGRLHPQKGLRFLIKAVNLIKNVLLPSTEFHIIGSGKLDAELKKMAKDKGVTNFFKFRGKIFGDELIKEYKSSHLFILPSVFEGQPLTLLEAWAAKLPVLVTDVGGNKDFVINLWNKEENGLMIEPQNPKILAQAILELSKLDRSRLIQIGENGYFMVKDQYSWDSMTKKTFEIYRELCVSFFKK
jgi:glycosyltransferase involved in cell wall biosynthesis